MATRDELSAAGHQDYYSLTVDVRKVREFNYKDVLSLPQFTFLLQSSLDLSLDTTQSYTCSNSLSLLFIHQQQ